MDKENRSSLAPFAIALVVFAVGLAGVAVFRFLRGDGLTEEQRVGRAAVAQNDALQREDYMDFRRFTCPEEQGTEDEVIDAHRKSMDLHGARYIDDVADVRINGDSATATVVYNFELVPDTEHAARLTFVRMDGDWLVCSGYP